MPPFAFDQIRVVEFGISRGSLPDGVHTRVPIDREVQRVLTEMVQATKDSLGIENGTEVEQYDPAQEHSPTSRAFLPLDHPLAVKLQQFYQIRNLPVQASSMEHPEGIAAYFCLLHDSRKNKLLAIRKAAQFKAILKARLIQVINDSLTSVSDNIFKLDRDFDIIIVDSQVWINRVQSFEQLAEIDEIVRAAAVDNTRFLATTLPFVNFDGVIPYVEHHARAARLVAALRARDDLATIERRRLARECNRSGVEVHITHNQLVPEPGQELQFLQLLDRRRYALSLVPGTWEQYVAGSRTSAGVRAEQPQPQVNRAG